MSSETTQPTNDIAEETATLSPEETNAVVERFSWAIRSSDEYKDEYKDCSSMRGRFQQYFVHGKFVDCQHWKIDYDDSLLYERKDDANAGMRIIRSEKKRRDARMAAHYGNNVWTKRTEPPADWNKPLPEWLEKRNENTFLAIKSKEMQSGEIEDIKLKPATLCSIM